MTGNFRIIEIIQTAINRNEIVAPEDIEKRLASDFREWEERLKDHLQAIENARERDKSLLSIEESRKISDLYRKLVKILHPDVSPGIYSENRKLWEQVQEAYKNGDTGSMETLWLIVQDIDSKPERELPAWEQLKDKERQLKKHVQEVKADIAELTSGYPYDLKEKLADDTWVEKEKENLRREMTELSIQSSKFKILAEQMVRKHCHG